MDCVLHLLGGGAGNLAAYLAAHVLLCLFYRCVQLPISMSSWAHEQGLGHHFTTV